MAFPNIVEKLKDDLALTETAETSKDPQKRRHETSRAFMKAVNDLTGMLGNMPSAENRTTYAEQMQQVLGVMERYSANGNNPEIQKLAAVVTTILANPVWKDTSSSVDDNTIVELTETIFTQVRKHYSPDNIYSAVKEARSQNWNKLDVYLQSLARRDNRLLSPEIRHSIIWLTQSDIIADTETRNQEGVRKNTAVELQQIFKPEEFTAILKAVATYQGTPSAKTEKWFIPEYNQETLARMQAMSTLAPFILTKTDGQIAFDTTKIAKAVQAEEKNVRRNANTGTSQEAIFAEALSNVLGEDFHVNGSEEVLLTLINAVKTELAAEESKRILASDAATNAYLQYAQGQISQARYEQELKKAEQAAVQATVSFTAYSGTGGSSGTPTFSATPTAYTPAGSTEPVMVSQASDGTLTVAGNQGNNSHATRIEGVKTEDLDKAADALAFLRRFGLDFGDTTIERIGLWMREERPEIANILPETFSLKNGLSIAEKNLLLMIFVQLANLSDTPKPTSLANDVEYVNIVARRLESGNDSKERLIDRIYLQNNRYEQELGGILLDDIHVPIEMTFRQTLRKLPADFFPQS